MEYEAIQVDVTTWIVKRSGKKDGVDVADESLLRDMPAGTTKDSAIAAAIQRNSWA